MEKKYPKFVVGAFMLNDKGELFLRTTPKQDNKYTCINEKVEWGSTIEETLRKNIKEKTNLDMKSFALIGLTDGLNIAATDNPEPNNLIFADYKVFVKNINEFKSDDERKHKWLLPSEWLKIDKALFGPYIREVIEKLV